MNLTQLSLLVLVAIGLYWMIDGRPINRAKELVFSGTVAGIEACAGLRSSELVAGETVRNFCARKHQIDIYSQAAHLNGRASVQPNFIQGKIKNNTNDFLVTEIEFEAIKYSSAGVESSFRAVAQTWIAPGEETDFSAEFLDREGPKDFPDAWCSQKEVGSEEISCKAWAIKSARGVRF